MAAVTLLTSGISGGGALAAGRTSATPTAGALTDAAVDVVAYSTANHRLTLLHNGHTTAIGTAKYDIDGQVYRATRGLVFDSGNVIEQVDSHGALHALSKNATATGVVVSNGGRWIAWGEMTSKGRTNAYTAKFIDEADPTHMRQVRTSFQPLPTGILATGQVALADQGGNALSVLWQPSTGQLHTLAGVHGVESAAGHTLVVADGYAGCALTVRDTQTGKSVPVSTRLLPCEFVGQPSADGGRLTASFLASDGTHLFIVLGLLNVTTGATDPQLGKFMASNRWTAVDFRWLDDGHLALLALQLKGSHARAAELSCAVPAGQAPRCTAIRELGGTTITDSAPGGNLSLHLVH